MGYLDSFSKAAQAKGDSAVYFLLGYAYYQRGFLLGDSDFADKKDAQETVNAYTKALELDPPLKGVAQPYKLYHSLGMSYEALGEYEKAVDAYRKAFSAAPGNPLLPLYAARLRFRKNDMAKAAVNLDLSLKKARETGQLKALLKVVEKDPRFSSMLNDAENLAVLRRYDPAVKDPSASLIAAAAMPAALGKDAGTLRDAVKAAPPDQKPAAPPRQQDKQVLDTLSAANDDFKFQRFRPALNSYNEALDLNKHSGILDPTQIAFIYERIGTSYNRLGLSADAIKALQKCVQAAPMDAAAHYQLSLAYAVLGNSRESIHALSEALRSVPSAGELKRYLLLAKTDAELEAVRELPAFRAALDEHNRRASALR